MKKRDKQSSYILGGAKQFNRLIKKALFGVLFLTLVFIPVLDVSASLLDEKRAELERIRQNIDQYEAQEEKYAVQANTLQGQINSLNYRIDKLQASINFTETKIDEARLKINELNDQIGQKQEELAEQKEILGQAIKYMYEEGETPFIETLFSSDTFSQILDRTEYLNTAELKVEKAMGEIESIKQELQNKRKEQREKKREQQKLREELEIEYGSLAGIRQSKNQLLEQTQNKEAAYQALVKKNEKLEAQAQAEISSLLSQYYNNGNYVSQGHINVGDVVGYIGSTGYSTGPHLHLEVRNGPYSTVNPLSYLGDRFIWPFPSSTVTQWYGWTPYARSGAYGGKPHSGIDFGVAYGTPIPAIGSGEIIHRGYSQYGYGNMVMIDHGDLITLYAHMK
jgi:peptidoglycan hydrolase CwlO-like protein